MKLKFLIHFVFVISLAASLLGDTWAQINDKVNICKVHDIKAIALLNNDEQVRVKLTEDWLVKYGKSCEVDQLAVIKNNLPAWLGTANTNQISQTVDSLYLKKKASKDLTPTLEGVVQQNLDTPSRAINSISTNKKIPNQTVSNKTTPPAPFSSPTMANASSNTPLPVSQISQPRPTSKEFAMRQEEISQCLDDDIKNWGDGEKDSKMLSTKMVFVYQHLGAPKSVTEQSILSVLKAAASSWDQCGGANLVISDRDYTTSIVGLKITVDWNEKETVGTIGIANIAKRKLTFNPETVQKVIQINASKNLNESYLQETLQMTASHEMGHFQGLSAHSRRCVDVLSYYSVGGQKCTTRNGGSMPVSFYEYRSSLPTSCDIERCRIANKN
jgi:hypothetical protein